MKSVTGLRGLFGNYEKELEEEKDGKVKQDNIKKTSYHSMDAHIYDFNYNSDDLTE